MASAFRAMSWEPAQDSMATRHGARLDRKRINAVRVSFLRWTGLPDASSPTTCIEVLPRSMPSVAMDMVCFLLVAAWISHQHSVIGWEQAIPLKNPDHSVRVCLD